MVKEFEIEVRGDLEEVKVNGEVLEEKEKIEIIILILVVIFLGIENKFL